MPLPQGEIGDLPRYGDALKEAQQDATAMPDPPAFLKQIEENITGVGALTASGILTYRPSPLPSDMIDERGGCASPN